MVGKLIFSPEAEQDIAEAYVWYERRRTGLGEEFLSCVEACVGAIRRTPEIHPVIHESYRRALVRRFPFGIFFEFEEDAVTVYGVMHTSRDPGKWRRRLR